jgi:hypothetical protein
MEYFLTKHAPRADQLLRSLGMIRSEVIQPTVGPEGQSGPFQVLTHLYFAPATSRSRSA